jgi:hypothetical protein
MADFNGSLVIEKVLRQLGNAELRRVKGMIGSKTLRAAITLIIDESKQRADLFIPHYWAIWYHDGRGRVSPVNARKLVFFDDPNDDPRIQGGRPVTESQVRRLTKEQYREGLRRNQERAAAGRRPFMYVVDSVGPAAPRPFFKKLEQGAADRADVIVAREFERELLAWIDKDKDVKSETRIADFGFGL